MEAACTNKVCLAFDDGQDPDEDVPHAQAAPLSSEHAAVCAVSLAAANAQASGAEHIPTRGRRCHRNQRLWRQAELAGAALFLLLAGGGAGFLASSLLHSSELSVSSGPDRGSTAVTPPVNGASIARTDASPSQKEYVCEYIYRFDGDCDEDPVETYLDVMALEQCERLCCSDDGCVSFAYTATRFTCWLYRHCGIYVTNQNTTTGMKKTSRPTAAEEAGAPWPLLGVPSAPTPWSPPPSASQFPTLAPTQATTSVPTPAPSAALIPAPTSAIMPGQTPIPTMSFGSRIQPMRDTRKCVSAVQLGSSSAGLWILDCSEENLSQLWKMDMYGHIRLASNLSLCIHGHGDYFSKGPSAQLSECSSLKSGQQWLMTNGGHMRLQPSMDLCLEVDGSADGGNAVEMRKCAIEATNQLFIADFPATALYAATPPPPLPPTRILATTPAPTQAVGSLIRLKHQPDKCLGYTDGSSDEGADLRLWDCNNSDPLQLWRMDVSGLIRLAHSQEMCLHVNTIDRDSSGESDEDVPVWSSSSIAELHTCNLASPDQQWVVSPAGHIRLRSDISWCIESPKDTSIGDKSTSLRKCKHADDRQLFDLAFPATAPDVDPPTPAPATTAPTPAQTTPGESSEPDGYNLYLGSTCNDTFLDPSTVASARECREVCDADPRCNAYSYHVQRRRCYTREACDNRVENDAYVTAIKEYYGKPCTPTSPCLHCCIEDLSFGAPAAQASFEHLNCRQKFRRSWGA